MSDQGDRWIAWYRLLQRVKPSTDEAFWAVRFVYDGCYFVDIIRGLTRSFTESIATSTRSPDFPLEWATALRKVADEVESYHYQILAHPDYQEVKRVLVDGEPVVDTVAGIEAAVRDHGPEGAAG